MSKSVLESREDAPSELTRVPWGTDVAEVARLTARDGGVILTGVLTRDQVDVINADLDEAFDALSQGNQSLGERKDLADFLGYKTKRLPHTLMYSKIFREAFLASPLLAEYVAAVVPGRAGCHSYLNVGSSRVDLQACKLEYSIVSPK